MQAHFASGIALEELLDPQDGSWSRAGEEPLPLIGTPAGLQPTAAIRNSWVGKKIGAIEHVRVRAAHNGEALAFRLEWEDATHNDAMTDTTAFSDAAAVALPASPASVVATMGAPGAAVNAWYWRADEPQNGRHVVAEGLGTTRTLAPGSVRASGVWKEGRWSVVIARALQVASPEPVVRLEAGATTGFAVAVWDGSNQERGGIKGFSGEWRELQLAPGAITRR